MPEIDYRHGFWAMKDEESNNYIAVITDIQMFVDLLVEADQQKRIAKIREKLDDAISWIEFAPVTIGKNGMVKWKGGEFAQRPSCTNGNE